MVLYTKPGNYSDGIITLLEIMSRVSTKVHTLRLKMNIGPDIRALNELANFIKSQRRLRKFDITDLTYTISFSGVISALKNQENSLRELVLNGRYTSEFMVFNSFEKLEVLRIKNHEAEPLLKQLSDVCCKISTLDINIKMVNTDNVIPLLRKSGSQLQRLSIVSSDCIIPLQSKLLRTLTDFCPNIIYFCIYYIELSNQLLKLIEGLRKLQFLSLGCTDTEIEITKSRIISLSKTLPSTLRYLQWDYVERNKILDSYTHSSTSYIQSILKYCEAPLEKLIIYELDKGIIKAIIDFCIRKGTLKYGCYMNGPRILKSGCYLNRPIDYWEELEELEEYIELMTYKYIVVRC
ncbi:5276_t:CDS:1 [Scutellospora calospora]|uniref:5276_t:CDS:1 n=1 Tax=Scutellospora calospora TaxID=85575 RepID=A0ACA9M2L6_9GLOM|nr:5276_t:CDS:1 [Scutellospora calospora]